MFVPCRAELFSLINQHPTVYEVVTGRVSRNKVYKKKPTGPRGQVSVVQQQQQAAAAAAAAQQPYIPPPGMSYLQPGRPVRRLGEHAC